MNEIQEHVTSLQQDEDGWMDGRMEGQANGLSKASVPIGASQREWKER